MKKYIYSLAVLLSVFAISCDKEEKVVVPVPGADFTFEVDGKTVSFTNTSTDASSYAWDFGDGNSSTEASPTHTYTGNGSYIAKLTVTNESGSDDRQAVLEIINVAIDGSFTDWESVDTSIGTASASGSITSIKLENLENNKLFIYVEGTEDLSPLTQIMLNTDNDRSTGAQIDWLYLQGGEDLLVEGSLTAEEGQYASIYECAPCDGSNPGNWNWGQDPINGDITSFLEASEIKSIPGGKAYELAIDLTALGKPIADDGIGIAVLDIDIATWGPIGAAPMNFEENDNPEGTLFTYTFK